MITPSGPLVECETITLSWANETIPNDVVFTSRIWTSVTWREIDDEGKPTGEVSLDSQSFSTPGTEFLYHVNYPAGSIFNFHLDASSSSDFLFSETSGNYIVQPGKSSECSSCIIFEVQPVSPTVTECEPLRISWTGGDSPSHVFRQ